MPRAASETPGLILRREHGQADAGRRTHDGDALAAHYD
jgi:hypothetical protein